MAYTVVIDSVDKSKHGFVICSHVENNGIAVDNAKYSQKPLDELNAGVGVEPYGAILYDGTPRPAVEANLPFPNIYINGVRHTVGVNLAEPGAGDDGTMLQLTSDIVAGAVINMT